MSSTDRWLVTINFRTSGSRVFVSLGRAEMTPPNLLRFVLDNGGGLYVNPDTVETIEIEETLRG